MDGEHGQLTSKIETAYGVPIGHDPRNPLFNVTWDLDQDEGRRSQSDEGNSPKPVARTDHRNGRRPLAKRDRHLGRLPLELGAQIFTLPVAVRIGMLRIRDDRLSHGQVRHFSFRGWKRSEQLRVRPI